MKRLFPLIAGWVAITVSGSAQGVAPRQQAAATAPAAVAQQDVPARAVFDKYLCDLSQPEIEDRRPDARYARRHQGRRGCGDVGEGRPEDSQRLDAARRDAATRSGCLRLARHVAGDRTGPRGCRRSESRQGPGIPEAHANRIPERDPRLAGARRPAQEHGDFVAAAGRQFEQRLRQPPRIALRFGNAARAVSVGRSQDQPACRRRPGDAADSRYLPGVALSPAGRAYRGDTIRRPRRRRHSVQRFRWTASTASKWSSPAPRSGTSSRRAWMVSACTCSRLSNRLRRQSYHRRRKRNPGRPAQR